MAPRRQKGFSLVEAMVGITVGLVTVLVITQVLSTFQATRNSTSAGADAQENGLFAIQAISSDVRASGAGSYSSGTLTKSIYPCTNVCSYDSNNGSSLWCSNPANPAAVPAVAVGTAPIAAMSGAALTGATYKLPTPLAPIVIEGAPSTTSGGTTTVISTYAPGSDVITLRNSGRFIGSVPTGVSAAVDMSTSSLGVLRTFGFAAGDLAVITNETNCTVFQVTAVDSSALTLTHASATYNPAASQWSGMATASGTTNGVIFGTESKVYNLGSTTLGAISAREYSVAGPNGGSLQFREIKTGSAAAATILPLADNIVALKAQYGIAASASSPSVASWMGTDCTTSNCAVDWTGNWDPGSLTKDKVMLIRAVRLLVVARNGNKETTEVTPACTTGGYTTGPCPSGGTTQSDTTLPAIDFSTQNWAAANAWKHYRYKIYVTAVPIRNVLWNGSWSNQGE